MFNSRCYLLDDHCDEPGCSKCRSRSSQVWPSKRKTKQPNKTFTLPSSHLIEKFLPTRSQSPSTNQICLLISLLSSLPTLHLLQAVKLVFNLTVPKAWILCCTLFKRKEQSSANGSKSHPFNSTSFRSFSISILSLTSLPTVSL